MFTLSRFRIVIVMTLAVSCIALYYTFHKDSELAQDEVLVSPAPQAHEGTTVDGSTQGEEAFVAHGTDSASSPSPRRRIQSVVFNESDGQPQIEDLLSNIDVLVQLGDLRSLPDDFYLAMATVYCMLYESFDRDTPAVDLSKCKMIPEDMRDRRNRIKAIERAADAGFLHALEGFDEVFQVPLEVSLKYSEEFSDFRVKNERYLWQALARGSTVALGKLVFGYQDGITMRQDPVYAAASAITLSRTAAGFNQPAVDSFIEPLSASERDTARRISAQMLERFNGGAP